MDALTHAVGAGLAAVVKQRHVGQTVAVVDVATTLQDLRRSRETGEADRRTGPSFRRVTVRPLRHDPGSTGPAPSQQLPGAVSPRCR